jgi:hypothetical protein
MRVSGEAAAKLRVNSARGGRPRLGAARDAALRAHARETPRGIGLIASLTGGARRS